MFKTTAKVLTTSALKLPLLRGIGIHLAQTRRRGLILVYHRIGDAPSSFSDILPNMPCAIFQHQLETLKKIGQIVTLTDLLTSLDRKGPLRFVITFDDDYKSHVHHALPILLKLNVPATFFLSGRALHNLGPYWWEALESAIATFGLQKTRKLLGLPGRTPHELAANLEISGIDERMETIIKKNSCPTHLTRKDIKTIAMAGMQIGFHTLRHPRLDMLPGHAIDQALIEGRAELSAIACARIEYLAYPHGQTTPLVIQRARNARYKAACASGGRPVSSKSDWFNLGRWEPGLLEGENFLSSVILRLNR